MKKFSIDHDKEYYPPMLRDARKQNPDMFLFSSPWSPPGWMKPNNSMIGGAMRKTSFAPYALYFLKFLEGYKAEGVVIDAVTVQNETDAEQEGNMPACLWAQEQEMEFAARFLAPALRKAGHGYQDLGPRSQLQPVGKRDRRTQRSHCVRSGRRNRLARLRRRPFRDDPGP